MYPLYRSTPAPVVAETSITRPKIKPLPAIKSANSVNTGAWTSATENFGKWSFHDPAMLAIVAAMVATSLG